MLRNLSLGLETWYDFVEIFCLLRDSGSFRGSWSSIRERIDNRIHLQITAHWIQYTYQPCICSSLWSIRWRSSGIGSQLTRNPIFHFSIILSKVLEKHTRCVHIDFWRTHDLCQYGFCNRHTVHLVFFRMLENIFSFSVHQFPKKTLGQRSKNTWTDWYKTPSIVYSNTKTETNYFKRRWVSLPGICLIGRSWSLTRTSCFGAVGMRVGSIVIPDECVERPTIFKRWNQFFTLHNFRLLLYKNESQTES